MNFKGIIITFSILHFNNAALVPFITKCRSDDTECMKANAAIAIPLFVAGISNLGIEILDPLHMDRVDASKPDLKLIFTDLNMTGKKTCLPVDVHRDVPNSKLFVKIICSEVITTGIYELMGEVLGMKMQGAGPLRTTVRGYLLLIEADLEIIERQGKKYLHLMNFKYSYDIDSADLGFENLSGCDEKTNKSIKNNGKNILKYIGGPVFDTTIGIDMKNLNNFFESVPIEELLLD